jgi:hypothetical protein
MKVSKLPQTPISKNKYVGPVSEVIPDKSNSTQAGHPMTTYFA